MIDAAVNVRRATAPVAPKERRPGRPPGAGANAKHPRNRRGEGTHNSAKLLADANAKAIAILCAGMAELVDARVSKTRSLGSAGSIPAARTKYVSRRSDLVIGTKRSFRF